MVGQHYNNPFESIVRNHIHEAVRSLVQEKYAAQIKEIVASKVTDEFTVDLFDKLWKAFESRYS